MLDELNVSSGMTPGCCESDAAQYKPGHSIHTQNQLFADSRVLAAGHGVLGNVPEVDLLVAAHDAICQREKEISTCLSKEEMLFDSFEIRCKRMRQFHTQRNACNGFQTQCDKRLPHAPATMSTRALASAMRSASASPEKPPKMMEWVAPMRAQASMATTSSMIMGM